MDDFYVLRPRSAFAELEKHFVGSIMFGSPIGSDGALTVFMFLQYLNCVVTLDPDETGTSSD